MKRHKFSGFPGSHGTHEYFRHGGSIGNRSYPGRVFKGKRMAGRWGAETVTTRNLTVVAVRPEEHLLLIRGAVPGARNGTVVVRKPRGSEALMAAETVTLPVVSQRRDKVGDVTVPGATRRRSGS